MALDKGDQVVFVWPDGHTLAAPKDFVIIHDENGVVLRRCDVYVVPYLPAGKDYGQVTPQDRVAATNYYGKSISLVERAIALPDGPWKSLGAIDEIRYTRLGKYENFYFHPFKNDVLVEEDAGGNGFRIRLPDGCVYNWRGVVWP